MCAQGLALSPPDTSPQCTSPLPGLRTQDVCCRGAGVAWGVHDCRSCSEHLGKPQDLLEEPGAGEG